MNTKIRKIEAYMQWYLDEDDIAEYVSIFLSPIPQIRTKINIIYDIETKKFNRYNSLCCLKNINSFNF